MVKVRYRTALLLINVPLIIILCTYKIENKVFFKFEIIKLSSGPPFYRHSLVSLNRITWFKIPPYPFTIV